MSTATAFVINYNYGAFLEECLGSLDRQTMPNLRVVVIDDCSTDDSADILHRWSKRTDHEVELIMKKRNRGPAHSYNLALEVLKRNPTAYASFIDSDDFWLDEKFASQVREFDTKSRDTAVIYSDVSELFADGSTRIKELAPPREGESATTRILEVGSFFAVNAGLVRSDALADIAPFDEQIRVCDLHLWLQLSRVGEFFYLPGLVGSVRKHSGSMSNSTLAADRLRLISRNVESPRERRAARTRGRLLLKQLFRSADRPPADVYLPYMLAARDPWTIPYSSRLFVPNGAVRSAYKLWQSRG